MRVPEDNLTLEQLLKEIEMKAAPSNHEIAILNKFNRLTKAAPGYFSDVDDPRCHKGSDIDKLFDWLPWGR